MRFKIRVNLYSSLILRFLLLVMLAGLPVYGIAAQSEPSQQTEISQSVSQGLLTSQVQPIYPPLAREARIQGTVVLQALIGKDGTIENLAVVSGHPMLTQAALDAVKQWRYKPYLLNGEPVWVQTAINVNFVLDGASSEAQNSGAPATSGQPQEQPAASAPVQDKMPTQCMPTPTARWLCTTAAAPFLWPLR